MYTLVEEGNLASANTCVFVCDTEEDLDKLQDVPHGSWARVIEGTQTFLKGEDGWKLWRNEKKTYLELEDKPKINGKELVGDVGLDDLNLYSKDEVNDLLVKLYRFKGSVDTYDDLLEIEDPVAGDVYNVSDTGANWAWDGEDWDNLGAVITVDTEVTKESENPVTSKGIYNFIEDEIERRIETIELRGGYVGNWPSFPNLTMHGNDVNRILTHGLTILKIIYTTPIEGVNKEIAYNFMATAETHSDKVHVKATRTDEEGTIIYSGSAEQNADSLTLTSTYTRHTQWRDIA